jgi:hypothetical protein
MQWECVDWIHPAQDRDQRQNIVNTGEISVSIKGGEFLGQLSDC